MIRRSHIIFLGIALVLIFGELWFTKTIATQAQKDIIAIYHIDKLFHIIGGAFFFVLVRALFPRVPWKYVFGMALAGVIGWEVYEVIFDADVNWFFYHRRGIWRIDTIADLVADGVGMGMAWVMLRNKGEMVCRREDSSVGGRADSATIDME